MAAIEKPKASEAVMSTAMECCSLERPAELEEDTAEEHRGANALTETVWPASATHSSWTPSRREKW